ncbi:MAG: tetratricopeptide repeat protein [Pikeienuella sp.]
MNSKPLAFALAVLTAVLTAPGTAAARDGSLGVCGSLSAPVRDVIHHCRRALSRGGLSIEQEFAANLNLGDALMSAGQPGAARDAFIAAEEIGLERVELYIGRAGAEEALGERRVAAEQLDRALAMAPRSKDVRLARGAFFLRIGQAEAAFEEFDFAVGIDPEDDDALYNRGLTLIAHGSGDQAEADFSAVLRRAPNVAGAHYQRGRAREPRDGAGALADYAQAIELSPEWAQPYFAAGRLLDRNGQNEAANARFRRAFELGHKDPWLLDRIRSLGG